MARGVVNSFFPSQVASDARKNVTRLRTPGWKSDSPTNGSHGNSGVTTI